MTKEEWFERYKAHFMKQGLSEKDAKACAAAESFEVLSEFFEDDPEGAADEELSYWDGE